MDNMVNSRSGGRIVFLSHTGALGGAELSLLEIVSDFPGAQVWLFKDGPLASKLRASGVTVEIIEGGGDALEVRKQGKLGSFLRAIPGTVRLARAISRRTTPADLIYANTQKTWIAAAVAACFSRRTVVWHLHDIMSDAHFSRLLSRLAVWLANRVASAVIANSRTTGATFVACGGRAELMTVVHVGIDIAPFDAVTPQQMANVRRELGSGDDITVGLFGRIATWKGQHVLLEAVRSLPGLRAVIVGAPLFGEDAYQRELTRLASDPALAGRVQFLGFRPDIQALMQAMDIIVHTSTLAEPFGRVVVEGMMARRPVVAAAAGGVLEIIDHGQDGLLCVPGDAAALSRTLALLVKNPDLRERLAETGYKTAKARFTREHMLKGIREVLLPLLPENFVSSQLCNASAGTVVGKAPGSTGHAHSRQDSTVAADEVHARRRGPRLARGERRR